MYPQKPLASDVRSLGLGNERPARAKQRSPFMKRNLGFYLTEVQSTKSKNCFLQISEENTEKPFLLLNVIGSVASNCSQILGEHWHKIIVL